MIRTKPKRGRHSNTLRTVLCGAACLALCAALAIAMPAFGQVLGVVAQPVPLKVHTDYLPSFDTLMDSMAPSSQEPKEGAEASSQEGDAGGKLADHRDDETVSGRIKGGYTPPSGYQRIATNIFFDKEGNPEAGEGHWGYWDNPSSLNAHQGDLVLCGSEGTNYTLCVKWPEADNSQNIKSILVGNENLSARAVKLENYPNVESVDLTGCSFKQIEDLGRAFANCPKLQRVTIGMWEASPSKAGTALDMHEMFYGDSSLTHLASWAGNTAVNGVGDWVTDKVATMEGMFGGCTKLTDDALTGMSS